VTCITNECDSAPGADSTREFGYAIHKMALIAVSKYPQDSLGVFLVGQRPPMVQIPFVEPQEGCHCVECVPTEFTSPRLDRR